ncbi:SDR family NAD(P)-dependent oxidoreductase [Duganella sp. FT92W]|uniref:SDR family NAD(P)-dependent oxidoreductase n=1 Tax=Pseudoduganella rivuli TaxID=2666085 RepID=A0A7X2LR77_9BURK|nr:SDR family oxidoreductase [Pseudoduganella rivuli]MRV70518.1 SDR family NAD(P)-dependent oxidoreductase [Pseudoduganella rivuli]
MDTIQDKVIMITGASSGIGAACARLLARRGARLVLAARREERLASLAAEIGGGDRVLWAATDVTRVDQVQALAAAARARYGRIDVLVNNAGIMPVSLLAQGCVDDWDRMIDVNIKGVLYGIHAVLGDMLAQGSGHVINISSVAGLAVGPGGAVYSGTKFAVRAISDGLRQECTGKVRVTSICPGLVASELVDSVTHAAFKERVKTLYEGAMPAEAIADAVLYAIGQPAHVAVNEIVVRPLSQAF